MTDAAVGAAERIDELRRRNPNAVRLATLVSTAMRVEPELLRRCRFLIGDADVTAEVDLWGSDLLAGASPLALTLRPDVAQVLRTELAALPGRLRDEACRIVAAQHRDLHWSARLEERVNELEVRLGSDALADQENLLLAAVRELREATEGPSPDRQAQVDIARWLLGALVRLPAHLGRSEAGFAARAAGSIHLDRRPPDETVAPEGERERWMAWLLASADIGPRLPVGVRFTPGWLELNATGPGTATIELPATEPVVVDVEVRGRAGVQVARVQLGSADPVLVPVDADEVVLASLDGGRWTVRRGGVPPPAGFDFSARRSDLRPCLARDEAVSRTVDAAMGRAWWTVVTGAPGIGASTVLNAALDEVAALGKAVVVVHFFGVDPSWDEPDAIAASLEAQLRVALPPYGALPPPAEPGDAKARFTEVLHRAAEVAQRTGGVVVALDGLPGDRPDDVKEAMWGLPFPSQPPPGVRYLVTARAAGGIRDWLEDGDPIQVVDLGNEAPEVCRAMVTDAATALRFAFADVATMELTESVSASRLVFPDEPPHADELAGLAAGNPGRLAALLDWIAAQPANSVTIDRLPAPLTGRDGEAWARLARAGIEGASIAPAVVAATCTVGDLARAMRWDGPAGTLVEALEAVPDLFRLSAADDPTEAAVEVADASVVESFVHSFGADALAEGHRRHAEIWRDGPLTPASPYALEHAALHLTEAAAGDEQELSEVVQQNAAPERAAIAPVTIVGDVAYLARLLRSAGTQLARLAVSYTGFDDYWRGAALDRVLAAVGPLGEAEPDLAESAIVNEWVRLGRYRRELGSPRWAPVLELARIIDLDTVPADWFHEVSGPIATVGPDGRCYLAATGGIREIDPRLGTVVRDLPGLGTPLFIEAARDAVAVSDGVGIALVQPDAVAEIPRRFPISAMDATDEGMALGHFDGTVTLVRGPQQLVLAGHTAAVRRIRHTEDALLTAADDGTVCVWERDQRRRLVYRRHRAAVRHLVAGPSFVVSADDSGRVRAWSPTTGDDLALLPGHRAAVTGLVAYAGGFVSTAIDGSVLWWDLDDEVHRTLRAEGPPVAGVAVVPAPDGTSLLVTAEADGTVRWWDLQQGERRAVRVAGVVGPVSTLLGGPVAIVVHAEGIAGISVPDAPAGVDDTAAVALDSSGRQAIVSTPAGSAELELATGKVLRETPVAEAPDPPRSMALAGYPLVAWLHRDGTVRVDGKVLAEHVERIAADPVLGRLFLAGADGSVTLLGEVESARRTVLPPGPPVTALTAKVGMTMVGRLDGTVDVEVPGTGESTTPYRLAFPSTVTALAFSTFLCAGCTDGTVWRVDGAGAIQPMGRHDGPVTHLVGLEGPPARTESSLAPRRPVAVSAGRDGLLRAWDLASGRCVGVVVVGSEVTAMDAANGTLVVRTGAGDLWVLDARLPAWSQPSSLAEHQPQVAGMTVRVEAGSAELTAGVVASVTGLGAVDIVAARVVALPVDRFRAQRSRAWVGHGDWIEAQKLPLHEPVRGPDATVAVDATFTASGEPPEWLRLELDVSSPDLGRPLTLVATFPAASEGGERRLPFALPRDDPTAPHPRPLEEKS